MGYGGMIAETDTGIIGQSVNRRFGLDCGNAESLEANCLRLDLLSRYDQVHSYCLKAQFSKRMRLSEPENGAKYRLQLNYHHSLTMTANQSFQIPGNIRNIRRSLIALAIIFPALYVGLALFFSIRDHNTILLEARQDAYKAASALSGSANRIVGEVDGVLQGSAEDVQRLGLSTSDSDAAALHALL